MPWMLFSFITINLIIISKQKEKNIFLNLMVKASRLEMALCEVRLDPRSKWHPKTKDPRRREPFRGRPPTARQSPLLSPPMRTDINPKWPSHKLAEDRNKLPSTIHPIIDPINMLLRKPIKAIARGPVLILKLYCTCCIILCLIYAAFVSMAI